MWHVPHIRFLVIVYSMVEKIVPLSQGFCPTPVPPSMWDMQLAVFIGVVSFFARRPTISGKVRQCKTNSVITVNSDVAAFHPVRICGLWLGQMFGGSNLFQVFQAFRCSACSKCSKVACVVVNLAADALNFQRSRVALQTTLSPYLRAGY
jgi:hypothetical protein